MRFVSLILCFVFLLSCPNFPLNRDADFHSPAAEKLATASCAQKHADYSHLLYRTARTAQRAVAAALVTISFIFAGCPGASLNPDETKAAFIEPVQFWLIVAVSTAAMVLVIARLIRNKISKAASNKEQLLKDVFLRRNVELGPLQELILKIIKEISNPLTRMRMISELVSTVAQHSYSEAARKPLWALFDQATQEYLTEEGGDEGWIRTAASFLPKKETSPELELKEIERAEEENKARFLSSLTKEGVEETAPKLVELLYSYDPFLLVKIFQKFDLLPLLVETLRAKGLPIPSHLPHVAVSITADAIGISL